MTPEPLALGVQPLSLAPHPTRRGLLAARARVYLSSARAERSPPQAGLVDGGLELRNALGRGERRPLARLLHPGGGARSACWAAGGDALVAGYARGAARDVARPAAV